MIGIPLSSAARAACWIAVIWGTPTPEITRVVQIEPGPMPTFTASAPAAIRSVQPWAVATFPATTSISHSFLILRTVSITLAEWPWALSTTSTSTPLAIRLRDALVIVDADGGTDPQPALPIFTGLRKSPHHVDIFDRNQARQPKIFVNQQKLLHLFCH